MPKILVTVSIDMKLSWFFLRGHGTYVEGEKLIASVAGIVERVNKLICVRPFKTRYSSGLLFGRGNSQVKFMQSCSTK